MTAGIVCIVCVCVDRVCVWIECVCVDRHTFAIRKSLSSNQGLLASRTNLYRLSSPCGMRALDHMQPVMPTLVNKAADAIMARLTSAPR